MSSRASAEELKAPEKVVIQVEEDGDESIDLGGGTMAQAAEAAEATKEKAERKASAVDANAEHFAVHLPCEGMLIGQGYRRIKGKPDATAFQRIMKLLQWPKLALALYGDKTLNKDITVRLIAVGDNIRLRHLCTDDFPVKKKDVKTMAARLEKRSIPSPTNPKRLAKAAHIESSHWTNGIKKRLITNSLDNPGYVQIEDFLKDEAKADEEEVLIMLTHQIPPHCRRAYLWSISPKVIHHTWKKYGEQILADEKKEADEKEKKKEKKEKKERKAEKEKDKERKQEKEQRPKKRPREEEEAEQEADEPKSKKARIATPKLDALAAMAARFPSDFDALDAAPTLRHGEQMVEYIEPSTGQPVQILIPPSAPSSLVVRVKKPAAAQVPPPKDIGSSETQLYESIQSLRASQNEQQHRMDETHYMLKVEQGNLTAQLAHLVQAMGTLTHGIKETQAMVHGLADFVHKQRKNTGAKSILPVPPLISPASVVAAEEEEEEESSSPLTPGASFEAAEEKEEVEMEKCANCGPQDRCADCLALLQGIYA